MKPPDWKTCNEEQFWTYIAWHLNRAGIDTVLVGGAVVAIYTEGLYQSKDIDLVPDDLQRDRIEGILVSIGFEHRRGRHFAHPECDHLYVEFPPGPVSLGDDYAIRPAERLIEGQCLKLLSPTDCVKDRLASYIHWRVRDCFDQAVLVAQRQRSAVDLHEVRRWCGKEGSPQAWREFESALDAEDEGA